MTPVRRCGFVAAFLATGLIGTFITAASAQDTLGPAKTLYVNASYEEALAILDRQLPAAGTSGPPLAELQHYRALCLIALGRTTEADQAIALSVAADPFKIPDTSELSPRVASVFTTARAKLIPDVARTALAEGRQLMQKGDAAGANRRFEAVTKLLAEPGLEGRAELTDLTLAANAFAELTKTQMAAAAAAAAAAVPAPQAAAVPPAIPPPPAAAGTAPAGRAGAAGGARPAAPPAGGQSAVAPVTSQAPATGGPGFEPAVPISQVLPPWQPESAILARLTFAGALRLTIDATGHVTDAVMEKPTYPRYDRLVLTAARDWTYKPATRNGAPVPSQRIVEILLRPPTGVN